MAIRLMLILALLAPAAAHAAGKVDEAERLVAKMEYKKALKVVGRILSSPKSEPGDLAAAFRLQGMCMIGLGKTKKAIESFRRLLAIQPTYRIPKETSPNAKAPFFKALSMKGQKPIALSHQAPPRAPRRLGGFKLLVNVESNPFGMIRAVRLRYRTETGKKWLKVMKKVKRPGRVACKLPRKLRAKEISYFFEVVNKKGGVLARAGSADEPFKLGKGAQAPVVAAGAPEPEKPPKPKKPEELETPGETPEEADPVTDFESTEEEKPVATEETAAKEVVESTEAAPPEPPAAESEPGRDNGAWYTTWWFWTAVGVVAAGAVTGMVLAATAGGDSGTPSAYEVILDW